MGASLTGVTEAVNWTALLLSLKRDVPPLSSKLLISRRVPGAGSVPTESSANRAVKEPATPFQLGEGWNLRM